MLYSQFGTKVTVLEAMPNLLPFMDNELTEMLAKKLKSSGVDFYTNARVTKVESLEKNEKIIYEFGGKSSSTIAEKVLVAVGRRTNVEALKIDKAGVVSDSGKILVNEKMQTNVPNIYAIGDCLGQVMLAHAASAQGEIAASNALGGAHVYNEKTNPSCVYTNPEFAGVGYTEERAKIEGLEFSVGRFPLSITVRPSLRTGEKVWSKFL